MKSIMWKAFLVCTAALLVTSALTIVVQKMAHLGFNTASVLMALLAPYAISMPLVGYLLYQSERHRKAIADLDSLREDLERSNADLRRKVEIDPMTGFLNREYFMKKLSALRRKTDRGTLLILDADHFKSINDSYGHLIGDEALIAITRRIRESVRAHDIVGRIGGEEFAVYLRGAGKDDAFLVAERVRRAVADIVFEPEAGRRHPLTVSIGGVVEAQDLPVPEALRRADTSLYKAKNGGRNLVVIDGARPQAA
ncbi:GGDEF domain-containing protein [Zhengella sp. ZM62]|uniref:GGDEF domain-containing protein n=1 Tax=Zhengella sedimenti TaxID=3390035 RepID=UPI003976D6E7